MDVVIGLLSSLTGESQSKHDLNTEAGEKAQTGKEKKGHWKRNLEILKATMLWIFNTFIPKTTHFKHLRDIHANIRSWGLLLITASAIDRPSTSRLIATFSGRTKRNTVCPWQFLLCQPHSGSCGNCIFLTFSFWRISWVGLFLHSVMVTSGFCSCSGALEVLLCRLTFECLGTSNSSKLLNSGSLEFKRKSFIFPAFLM